MFGRFVIASFDSQLERIWSAVLAAHSLVNQAGFRFRDDESDPNYAVFTHALVILSGTLLLANLHTMARLQGKDPRTVEGYGEAWSRVFGETPPSVA
jgi:hypothetical protein